MIAVWLFLRALFRRHRLAWLSLALIVGIFTAGVVTSAAGALRTGSAHARFLDWSRAPDALVLAEPYDPSFARLSPAAVMRVPQAADAAIYKSYDVTHDNIQNIQFFAPASNAIPGSFWKRKILSGRMADPGRPDEVNISFTLAQRSGLRPGDSLRLMLETPARKRLPLVFRITGIDAAHIEFPPQPLNGTYYYAWGTPAFYHQHQSLSGLAQVALRLQHGARDWPAAQHELNKQTHGKILSAMSLVPQSVNTQRSIGPQATALWLLAALFAVIGLIIVTRLLARLSFLEAAEYGTLRALGMNRAQLMAAGLGRAAAIGAVGGLIGAVLGVAFSPLLPVGLARVAEPHPGIDANVPVLAAGLAAAVLITVVCAAWPGWRAGREAGGRADRARPTAPHGRLPAGRGLAGLTGHRRAAGAAPRRRRDGGAGTQRGRQRHGGRGRAQRRDRVRGEPQPPARLARAVRRDLGRHREHPSEDDVRPIVASLEQDRNVAAWSTAAIGLPLRSGGTGFDAIVPMAPGDASFVSAPVTGRLPRNSGEIALGARTLRQLHARIGATIRVSVPVVNGPARPVTVVGTTVFASLTDTLGLGTGAVLTPGSVRDLLPPSSGTPSPSDVLIRFRPGFDPAEGRQALAARLARLGSHTVQGPATPTDLLNFGQVRDLPQVLGVGLAAVALLTIAHLLITSVRRRRRVFAVLRALGFTPWQVRRTLVSQAVTLAGIALVIGIPAGIACGRLCWQVFAQQLGITPVTAVPLAVLALSAACWLAAAALVAVLPGEAATRNPAARVLRSE
jgi:ABC-type lipoprotein release transport system permease subunit